MSDQEIQDLRDENTKLREERDDETKRRKEMARDFEAAFRVLRQENDRLQSDASKTLQIQLMASRSTVASLQSQLAEARKDTEIINAIESFTRFIDKSPVVFPEIKLFGDIDGWNLKIDGRFYKSRENLRAALNVAMTELAKTP